VVAHLPIYFACVRGRSVSENAPGWVSTGAGDFVRPRDGWRLPWVAPDTPDGAGLFPRKSAVVEMDRYRTAFV